MVVVVATIAAALISTTPPPSFLALLQTIMQKLHLTTIQLIQGDFEKLFTYDETRH